MIMFDDLPNERQCTCLSDLSSGDMIVVEDVKGLPDGEYEVLEDHRGDIFICVKDDYIYLFDHVVNDDNRDRDDTLPGFYKVEM